MRQKQTLPSYRHPLFVWIQWVAALAFFFQPVQISRAVYVPDPNFSPYWVKLTPSDTPPASGPDLGDSNNDGMPNWWDQFQSALNSGTIAWWGGNTFLISAQWIQIPGQYHLSSAGDTDGDGIPNDIDPFPNDPNNNTHWWGGGNYIISDLTEHFDGQYYAGSTADTDGDGIPDVLDSFSNDQFNNSMVFWWTGGVFSGYSFSAGYYYGSWSDYDGDLIPDAADPYPDDASNGYGNGSGSLSWGGGDFWIDGILINFASVVYGVPWEDEDGDGIPDPADPYPSDCSNNTSWWGGGIFLIDGTYTTATGQYHCNSSGDSDVDGIPDDLDPYPEDATNNTFWWSGGTFNMNGVIVVFNAQYYAGSDTDDDENGIPDVIDHGGGHTLNNTHWWDGGTYLIDGAENSFDGQYYAGASIDTDGDGIPNALDPYPNDAWNNTYFYWNGGDFLIDGNLTHFNGASYGGFDSDSDEDGIPDIVDPYSDDNSNNSSWWDGGGPYLINGYSTTFCGCWHAANAGDSDGDGIPDDRDQHPDDDTNNSALWCANGQVYVIDGVQTCLPDQWHAANSSDSDEDGIPNDIDPYQLDGQNNSTFWQGATYQYEETTFVFGPGWYPTNSFESIFADSDENGIPDSFELLMSDGGSFSWWLGGKFIVDSHFEVFATGFYHGPLDDPDSDGIPDIVDPYLDDSTNNTLYTFNWPGGTFWVENGWVIFPATICPGQLDGSGNPPDIDQDGMPDAIDPYPEDFWNLSFGFIWPPLEDGSPTTLSFRINYNVATAANFQDTTFSSTIYYEMWQDTDDDGIPDVADQFFWDPLNNNDSDLDLLTDTLELNAGLDPNDPNDVNELRTVNGDQDGLTWLQAWREGIELRELLPFGLDSDGDGMTDVFEITRDLDRFDLRDALFTPANDLVFNFEKALAEPSLDLNTPVSEADYFSVTGHVRAPILAHHDPEKSPLENDWDGDGISNYNEVMLFHTDSRDSSSAPNLAYILEAMHQGSASATTRMNFAWLLVAETTHTLSASWLANFNLPANTDALGDADHDELLNWEEFLQGTDPTDFYNGVQPQIAIVSGDGQTTCKGTPTMNPLVVRVTRADNSIMINAPVTFTVSQGISQIGVNQGDVSQIVWKTSIPESLTSFTAPRTGSDGCVSIRLKGAGIPENAKVTANAGGASVEFNLAVTALPNAPTPPSNLQLDLGWNDVEFRYDVTLTWSDNSTGESGFSLERSHWDWISHDWVVETLQDVPPNTVVYTDEGIDPYQSYRYRVCSFTTMGLAVVKSEFSNPANVIASWPYQPVRLLAQAMDAHKVSLSWVDGNSGLPFVAPAYRLTRQRVDGTGAAVSINLPATQRQYEDTTVLPATDYVYELTALNVIHTDPVRAYARTFVDAPSNGWGDWLVDTDHDGYPDVFESQLVGGAPLSSSTNPSSIPNSTLPANGYLISIVDPVAAAVPEHAENVVDTIQAGINRLPPDWMDPTAYGIVLVKGGRVYNETVNSFFQNVLILGIPVSGSAPIIEPPASASSAAMVIDDTGDCVISGLVLSGRLMAESMGAHINSDGRVRLVNCIIRDNHTSSDAVGAGMSVYYGTVTLENCIFADNVNTASGCSGIRQNNGTTVFAVNSIFWDGRTTAPAEFSNDQGSFYTTHCLVRGFTPEFALSYLTQPLAFQSAVVNTGCNISTLKNKDLFDVTRTGLPDLGAFEWVATDSDADGLPDWWQKACFGSLSFKGSQDTDLDGYSNSYEYLHNTDPTDFYNGAQSGSLLSVYSLNPQTTIRQTVAQEPLIAKLTLGGAVLKNAPITFSVSPNGSLISIDQSNWSTSVSLLTDQFGMAQVWFMGSDDEDAAIVTATAGSASCQFNVTVAGLPPALVAPSNLILTYSTSTQSTHLAWTDNATGESAFIIESSSLGDYGWSAFVWGTLPANTTDYDTGHGDLGIAYRYRIAAVRWVGIDTMMSAYSNIVELPAIPAPLDPFIAQTVDSGKVALSWSPPFSAIDYYHLERFKAGLLEHAIDLPGTQTQFLVQALQVNTEYLYRLTATNIRGSSATVAARARTFDSSNRWADQLVDTDHDGYPDVFESQIVGGSVLSSSNNASSTPNRNLPANFGFISVVDPVAAAQSGHAANVRATIQAGIDRLLSAPPGSHVIVLVKGGVYHESISTKNLQVLILGDPTSAGPPVIEPTSNSSEVVLIAGQNGNSGNGDCVLSGLVLSGYGRPATGAGRGITVKLSQPSKQVRLVNCVITGNQGYIFGAGGYQGAGMYVQTGRVSLEHCTFLNNDNLIGSPGIYQEGSGADANPASTVWAVNSVFWDREGENATEFAGADLDKKLFLTHCVSRGSNANPVLDAIGTPTVYSENIIDQGYNIGTLSKYDIFHQTRSSVSDIGAIEWLDSDGDGLTNLEELAHNGFDTNKADTFGLGMSDKTAFFLFGDPALVDSDGDGYANGVDAFPLNAMLHSLPVADPLDTTGPTIALYEPTDAEPILP